MILFPSSVLHEKPVNKTEDFVSYIIKFMNYVKHELFSPVRQQLSTTINTAQKITIYYTTEETRWVSFLFEVTMNVYVNLK